MNDLEAEEKIKGIHCVYDAEVIYRQYQGARLSRIDIDNASALELRAIADILDQVESGREAW